jgi:uncharacterized membrane protein YcgQ (UPF0703/DUF1980 family)
MNKKKILLILILCAAALVLRYQPLRKSGGSAMPAFHIPDLLTFRPDQKKAGATTASAEKAGALEIGEKLFLTQVNDVYLNPDDYLGKTVLYEGVFIASDNNDAGKTYRAVIRYGPGCCGIGVNSGFEVNWARETSDWPKPDDWVEVRGVLEEYEENGWRYLRVNLLSLTRKEARGQATVRH